MSPEMREVIGLALACGASDVGGPFTKTENVVARRAIPAPKTQAQRVRSAIRDGADPLGVLFCEIRSPLERRDLGAFFTGSAILEPMMQWARAQNPSRFVDPGCGSGRFAVAAAAWKPQVEILAIDLDPVATLLTRAALAAIGAKRVRVLQGDYLTMKIPSHDGRTAFVGNPPYVRHHDLTPERRLAPRYLQQRSGTRCRAFRGCTRYST